MAPPNTKMLSQKKVITKIVAKHENKNRKKKR